MKLSVMCLAVVLFSLCVVPAQGKLGGTGYVGYYKPEFGEINDLLSGFNSEFGTDLQLKGGMIYGMGMRFDVNPRIGLRLEYSNFTSKTDDSYIVKSTYDDTVHIEKNTFSLEAKVTPIILSVIYRFSLQKSLVPYVGVGAGIFSSKLESEQFIKIYEDGTLVDSNKYSGSWSDSPLGFTVLGGVEKSVSENLTLIGEARYVSAMATFTTEGEEFDCDWSGFMGNVEIEYKFK